jgi:hypothetical protein
LDIGAPFSLQECTNNKNVAHGRYKGSISLEQKKNLSYYPSFRYQIDSMGAGKIGAYSCVYSSSSMVVNIMFAATVLIITKKQQPQTLHGGGRRRK